MNQCDVTLTVNGSERSATVPARTLLSDFIRNELGLVGTHVGCEHGVCGACTILLDGKAVRSCLTFAVQANGATLTTIEGLATGGGMHPLQEAFWEEHGLQCGFCTPGMLMVALELIERNSSPTDEEIREAISGNLCRCTGYAYIVNAIASAAAKRRGETYSSSKQHNAAEVTT